jgi:prepilin-type N-terminal cleavage/methylation domain-containing protein
MRLRRFSRGFTLTELMVVLVIIAALSAIAYPAIRFVRGRADRTACLSNLRQIGVGLESWLQDHNQTMPEWQAGRKSRNEVVPVLETELKPYLDDEVIFHCPADREIFRKSGSSYLWNTTQNGRPRAALSFFGQTENLQRIPLVTDKEDWHSGQSGVNYLYADMSASTKANFGVSAP